MVISLLMKLFPAINASSAAIIIGIILTEFSPSPIDQIDSKEEIFIFLKFTYKTIYRVMFGVGAILGAIIAVSTWKLIRNQFNMAIFDVFLAIGLAIFTIPHDDLMTKLLSVICRLLLGIGVGGLSVIVPSYITEITNPKSRGRFNMFFQVSVVLGIMLSYAFGPLVEYCPQNPLKALFNVPCCLWATIHAIVSYLMAVPESQVLIIEDDDDEMKFLMDDGYANIHETLIEIFKQINDRNMRLQLISRECLSNALSSRPNRRGLFIGIGLMFFHQLYDVNVITAYMDHTNLLKNVAIDVSSRTTFIMMGVLQIVVMLVSMTIIDKIGRRALLVSSAALMCISSVGLCGCIFVTRLNTDSGNATNMLSLIFIGNCVSAYSLGFGPVPWVIVGEIFSKEVKSYGMSFAIATNWTMVIAISYIPTNDIICSSTGIGVYLIVYSVTCLFGATFVWCLLPETKNISLAEIQEKLAESWGRIS